MPCIWPPPRPPAHLPTKCHILISVFGGSNRLQVDLFSTSRKITHREQKQTSERYTISAYPVDAGTTTIGSIPRRNFPIPRSRRTDPQPSVIFAKKNARIEPRPTRPARSVAVARRTAKQDTDWRRPRTRDHTYGRGYEPVLLPDPRAIDRIPPVPGTAGHGWRQVSSSQQLAAGRFRGANHCPPAPRRATRENPSQTLHHTVSCCVISALLVVVLECTSASVSADPVGLSLPVDLTGSESGSACQRGAVARRSPGTVLARKCPDTCQL